MEKSPSPSDSRQAGSVPGASAPGISAAPPPPTGLKAAFRGSEDFLPREKLARLGPGALSDAELVAIFLRTGRPGRNVLQVADDLLRAYGGNLRLLSQESAARLEGLGSIGRVRALELTAVFEFARRIAMHSQEAQPLLEEALRMFECELGTDTPHYHAALNGRGVLRYGNGDFAGAEADFLAAARAAEAMYGAGHYEAEGARANAQAARRAMEGAERERS